MKLGAKAWQAREAGRWGQVDAFLKPGLEEMDRAKQMPRFFL